MAEPAYETDLRAPQIIVAAPRKAGILKTWVGVLKIPPADPSYRNRKFSFWPIARKTIGAGLGFCTFYTLRTICSGRKKEAVGIEPNIKAAARATLPTPSRLPLRKLALKAEQ